MGVGGSGFGVGWKCHVSVKKWGRAGRWAGPWLGSRELPDQPGQQGYGPASLRENRGGLVATDQRQSFHEFGNRSRLAAPRLRSGR